jgi:hypothetical protein
MNKLKLNSGAVSVFLCTDVNKLCLFLASSPVTNIDNPINLLKEN